MKGLELPVNVLIIIAVALIALIAIIAMFVPIFGNSRGTVDSETAKNTACQIMISRGCAVSPNEITISDFDASRDGTINPSTIWDNTPIGNPTSKCTISSEDNLMSLCSCYYSTTDETRCMELCGC